MAYQDLSLCTVSSCFKPAQKDHRKEQGVLVKEGGILKRTIPWVAIIGSSL